MKIFNNNKSKNNSDQNIDLVNYERKLEERREEYTHLNEILRGMRAEVSNLMVEIKDVTDNLVKKNAELFLLEQSIEDLKRSYELLQQNVKYEEEVFNEVNIELAKIKKEINESLQYNDKLNSIKNEYESVSLQFLAFKEEIDKTKIKKPLPDVTNKNQSENNIESRIVKKKKKCQAKTKTGSKCKRYAVDDSLYCPFHSRLINSTK